MRALKCFDKAWRIGIAAFGLLLSLHCGAADPASTSAIEQLDFVRRLNALLKLDPETHPGQISDSAASLASDARVAVRIYKTERRSREIDFNEASREELKKHFHGPPDLPASREIRALEHIARTAKSLEPLAAADREILILQLREMMAGMVNNRRSPIPASVGVLTPWKLWWSARDRSIGHGSTPARNLMILDTERILSADLSLCDPKPSDFWQRPDSISDQDLNAGFGRKTAPAFSDAIWEYESPKTSSGTRPGFNVRSGGVELKVKLADVNSEPFTARIFHALGYHVDPTDYAPAIKVRYTRRIFREFNLRKPLALPLRPVWVPVGSLQLQPEYDPFDFVDHAVLKDGMKLSGADLKTRLLVNPSRGRAADDPENYREEFERTIDYVVTGPANIQLEESAGDAIGSWDFDGLGHEHRRELRGAGLLAAWLGWFDSRFDNTRLRIVEVEGRPELRFFFTDLGAGMGSGTGWLVRHGENPKAMESEFTSPRIVRGPGRMTTPFRVHHFQTIVPTAAFQQMTFDDARWMARMIAQLTPEQIRTALQASGYGIEAVELYLEKLLSRRSKMLRDLELE
ncbi:MAG TPA: hypothetical protein VEH04_07720 [Verrucomicrobiae bacterium]|nr:hypothetical protein [Verrucomicrobiae bacterium]